ncbi:MAG TPA: FecR domain-containing protein [Albitalea sp.]|jgi:hypothetical protein|nr:FecR domain-containing protein [Albitalea sp.]
MLRALILAAWFAASCTAVAADAMGTITILEGDAVIFRGVERLQAAEGVRLQVGDIVETAANTFAQVELVDQSVAQFGPATRVMINGATQKKPERWLYLMDGWAKVSGIKRDAAAGPGFDVRAPTYEIPASASVVVLRSAPGEVALFVERGDPRIAERQASGAPIVVPLKTGDFYRRRAPARGSVNPSTSQAFLAEVPRFFRDSLPLRIERYRDRPVVPRQGPDFAYADVETWLKAEPAVRRPLMQRWRSKAREPAFRAALVANLSAHPEWDPILFPEKYKPKDPPAPRGALAAGRPVSPASTGAP